MEVNKNLDIRNNVPNDVNKNLSINGIVTGLNIGIKTPLIFTTNRNMTIDGVSFSVYDNDLRKYTKSFLLDGYNISQVRIRHWPADADFETGSSTIYLCLIEMFIITIR